MPAHHNGPVSSNVRRPAEEVSDIPRFGLKPMISDLERLREMARRETLRIADEEKKKADELAVDAMRTAQEDLPRWTRSIEKAIRYATTKDSSYVEFEYETKQGVFGERQVWAGDAKHFAPSIDLERLTSFEAYKRGWLDTSKDGGLNIYTSELTRLLGEPSSLYHRGAFGDDYENYYLACFRVTWKK